MIDSLSAAYQGPSGERYTGEEDIPPGHTTLKGEMLPSSKGATVYSSFYDVSAGKFKPWEAIMDTAAIPQAAEVLPRRTLYSFQWKQAAPAYAVTKNLRVPLDTHTSALHRFKCTIQ